MNEQYLQEQRYDEKLTKTNIKIKLKDIGIRC